MRVTDKQIAEEFGLTIQTLYNWKTSEDKSLHKRYNALKNAIIEQDSIIWEVVHQNGKVSIINNCVIGHFTATNSDIKLIKRMEV